MVNQMKIVEANDPMVALSIAYPHWMSAVKNYPVRIPSDGYEIYAVHTGDVTMLTWANGDNSFICKAQAW